MSGIRIVEVDAADASMIEAVRELFGEYHEWLGGVVCSRTLGAETASLPGVYARPRGGLLLAFDGEVAVGVIGFRPFSDSPAEVEVKRLYVRPEARGKGVGRLLAESVLARAAGAGYTEALLTTLPASMERAFRMYERLGFRQSEPFYDHSHVDDSAGMLFMRRPL